MKMSARLLAFTLALTACAPEPTRSRIRALALERLTSAEVTALDPARTLFILESAPLEAHGPHLPIGADSYQGDYAARRMAEQLADSLPGWSIIRMPNLWYGIDGANRIPEREDIRGTLSLRPTTLRALATDLGEQLADQGLRWLFLVHVHGAPLEHAALSDAADFVRETRGFGMFNVGSLDYMASDSSIDSAVDRRVSAADRARIGFDLHAGFAETSTLLAVNPELVSTSLRSLPDFTATDWASIVKVGQRSEWRGYWSAPALADSLVGQRILDVWAARWAHFALRAVHGDDVSKLARFPDGMPPNPALEMSTRTTIRQRALDLAFARWIAQRHSIVDK